VTDGCLEQESLDIAYGRKLDHVRGLPPHRLFPNAQDLLANLHRSASTLSCWSKKGLNEPPTSFA